MVDSATINYGLSKLGATINQAAPFLKNVSEQYVHFTVVKTVALVPVAILLVIAAIIGLVYSIKWLKSEPREDTEAIICIVFSSIAVLICSIFAIAATYDCCIALWSPEMFTIQQIICAAKN